MSSPRPRADWSETTWSTASFWRGRSAPFGPGGVLFLDDPVQVLAEVDLRDAGLDAVDLPLCGRPPPAGFDHPAVGEHRHPSLASGDAVRNGSMSRLPMAWPSS